jgi:hypothetical protein
MTPDAMEAVCAVSLALVFGGAGVGMWYFLEWACRPTYRSGRHDRPSGRR